MNATTTVVGPRPILRLTLGVIAAGLVLAALAGVNLPLISGERAMMLALALVGMAMCSLEMGFVIRHGWASPTAVLGSALGLLILGIVASRLLGLSVPLIADDRQAIVAIAGLGLVKVAIGMLYNVSHQA